MMLRFLTILAVVLPGLALAACAPMPQRVKDEFSAPDGERPNNFEIVQSSDKGQ